MIRICRTFQFVGELGRDIRRGFIPREGWLLMAADYSQIELRLLAHLSMIPLSSKRSRQEATSIAKQRR